MDVNFNKKWEKDRHGTFIFKCCTSSITFKVAKMISLDGFKWDFYRFSKKMQKNQASSYYTRKWLMAMKIHNLRWLIEGSCNGAYTFKDRNRNLGLNCTKDCVKIDFLHFYDQISSQMTSLQDQVSPPLNCKTYIEPTSHLCVLTPAASRYKLGSPKRHSPCAS